MQRQSICAGSMPNAVPVELSDFTVMSELGRGAFGRVYLAELPSTGKLYAIKGIRKDKLIDCNQI